MDIQKNTSLKRTHDKNQQKTENKPNKDLLRLERPIYSLKKSQQNQSQYVIRKLMQKKQKPSIGIMGRSPLLSRLEQMMPIFKKSNQDIQHRVIQESEKIDAKLQQCVSSSSSQDQDQDDNEQMLQGQQLQVINQYSQTINLSTKATKKPKSTKNKLSLNQMQPQPTNPSQSQQMINESQQQKQKPYLQINFLRYPYLNEQQVAELQKKQLEKKKDNNNVAENKMQKKLLVEEIVSREEN